MENKDSLLSLYCEKLPTRFCREQDCQEVIMSYNRLNFNDIMPDWLYTEVRERRVGKLAQLEGCE